MNRFLLGTTALVAASFILGAGQAQAADPIKISVGGFITQAAGYVTNDEAYEKASGADFSEFDQIQTSEIHFRGSTKLDNGITVAVQFEQNFDGNNSENNFNVDEAYVRLISPSLGELRFGRDDGVVDIMGHSSPDGGALEVNGGEANPGSFIINPSAVSHINGIADGDNENRVIYLSPTFKGFSAGVSYNPDTLAGDREDLWQKAYAGTPYNTESQTSVAIAYNNKISGVDIGADVGYIIDYVGGSIIPGATNKFYDKDVIRGGLVLGYAGFTVGGSYAKHSVDSPEKPKDGYTDEVVVDGVQWDVGVTYATGPYKVGVSYKNSKVEGLLSNEKEDEVKWAVLGASYALGPGISLHGDLLFADYNDETDEAANNNDGWGFGASISVGF